MFGLTFEKLLLVAVIGGLLIGPQRLPHYAQQLARTIRSFRAFVETTRAQAEREMGVSLQPGDWDLMRYDPRRIVREAFEESPGAASPAPVPEETVAAVPSSAAGVPDERVEAARRIRPGQKYLVTGSAAHPRRILIESLPYDDPRRVAARVETPVGEEPDDGPATPVETTLGGAGVTTSSMSM